MKNIGPKSREWLASVGIHNLDDVATLGMGTLIRPHRVDDGDLVHLPGDVRPQRTDTDPVDVGRDHLGGSHDPGFLRLRIEGIEVRHPTAHEQVDHATGCSGEGIDGGAW